MLYWFTLPERGHEMENQNVLDIYAYTQLTGNGPITFIYIVSKVFKG